MRLLASFVFAAAPLLALAVPLRQTRSASPVDILVVQFALVLEHLETEFYTAALNKFTDQDIISAGYSDSSLLTEQIRNIVSDESSHAKALTTSLAALGGTEVAGCTFNFDSVLTDVSTAIATARVVENVGVGAYLGAAHLLSDPRVLEAAGSILTIEARHQTVLNILSGKATAIPSSFDMALNPNEVLALAGPFISGCSLGVPANLPLKITNTSPPTSGTTLTFSWDSMPTDLSGLNCQMMVGGAVNSISLPLSSCVVPDGLNGPVAIYITNSTQPLLNNVIDRAQTQTVAGPTMAFIDGTSEALSAAARSGASGASCTSSTTTDSSASPSATDSTAPPSATDSAAPPAATDSSGPILTTGPGPDGAISVNGWQNLPPSASTDSSSTASSTAPSSSSGPILSTGPGPDGAVNVNGWSNLPPGA